MDNEVKSLIIEYKFKLRLAKLVIGVLLGTLIFMSIIFVFINHFSNEAEYLLGESTGISETTRIFIDNQPSDANQNSLPSFRL